MNDPPRNDLDLIYQAILENRRLLLRLLGETEQNVTARGTAWHCARCGKRMQFFDGICFACNGGQDPGD